MRDRLAPHLQKASRCIRRLAACAFIILGANLEGLLALLVWCDHEVECSTRVDKKIWTWKNKIGILYLFATFWHNYLQQFSVDVLEIDA